MTCFHKLSEYETTNFFTNISEFEKENKFQYWSKNAFFFTVLIKAKQILKMIDITLLFGRFRIR
jgi:hypothetical protein